MKQENFDQSNGRRKICKKRKEPTDSSVCVNPRLERRLALDLQVLQKAAASRDNTHASLGSNTRSAYTENNLAACWKYDLCESLPVMHCAREKDLLLIR